MKKNNRFIKYVGIAIIICILLLSLDLVLSQKYISVTKYIYENTEIKQSFKIVQLTDLHNYQYGTKNYRLINKVKNETPDVIFFTGDMLNADEERTDILINLIRQLALVAPIYVSLGNHELEYMQLSGNQNLIVQMEETGAIVLNKEYLDTEINGQEVRLGGVYGYVLNSDDKDDSEQRFMEEFQNTDLNILVR